jgi:rhomboid family protein
MSWRDRGWAGADGGANYRPEGKPVVTLWILGVTAGFLLLLWLVGGGRGGTLTIAVEDALALRGDLWWQVWRCLTYGLIHGSFGHLIGNLLMVGIAGWIMENYFGRKTFLQIFLGLLGVSSLAFLLRAQITGFEGYCIGNSGAAVGLVVLLGSRFPKLTLLIWGIIPAQCWVLACIVVAADLFMVAGRSTGGVAVEVHLMGAAAGFFIGYIWPRLEGWRENASAARTQRREAKVRERDAEEQGELDRLLDKINREGMEKLTDRERQFLLSQSEKLKGSGRR